jgi:DNA-binding NarL/FixJ family response regulator
MRAKTPKGRKYLVAMVLGTTLSAMGSAAPAAETSHRAVSDISRYCTACWRNARLHPDSVELLPDRRGPEERRLQEKREMIGEAAREVLSPRQYQIVQMTLEGWSVHDMARELHLPAARISDEKYKAVRKLRDYLDVIG